MKSAGRTLSPHRPLAHRPAPFRDRAMTRALTRAMTRALTRAMTAP